VHVNCSIGSLVNLRAFVVAPAHVSTWRWDEGWIAQSSASE